jgi:hypothetical protein
MIELHGVLNRFHGDAGETGIDPRVMYYIIDILTELCFTILTVNWVLFKNGTVEFS